MEAVASVGRCAMAARLARRLANWLAHVPRRVVSCRSVTVVARAHVGRRTRPVRATFLAHRFAHVPGIIRQPVSRVTAANIRRDTNAHHARFATIRLAFPVLVQSVARVAGANVGRRAFPVQANSVALGLASEPIDIPFDRVTVVARANVRLDTFSVHARYFADRRARRYVGIGAALPVTRIAGTAVWLRAVRVALGAILRANRQTV